MILALLFLILFALLFPKALKFLLALALICSIAALSETGAKETITDSPANNAVTSAVESAIADMENSTNKCARSYFKANVGAFKAADFYSKGVAECALFAIRNTFPKIYADRPLMGRFFTIFRLKGKEQERALALDPDVQPIEALLVVAQHVKMYFKETMVKRCVPVRGKPDTLSCTWNLGD